MGNFTYNFLNTVIDFLVNSKKSVTIMCTQKRWWHFLPLHMTVWFVLKKTNIFRSGFWKIFYKTHSFWHISIINYHSNYIWAKEYPYVPATVHHQQQFYLNMWTWDSWKLLGPQILLLRLNGDTYTYFLEEMLPVLPEDIPLPLRIRA